MCDVEMIEAMAGEIDGQTVGACPFCGQGFDLAALIGAGEADGVALSAIYCAACAATGPMVPGGLTGALSAWSRRARMQ